MTKTQAAFRLAMREEGKVWNAYMAKRDTMDGALLLGSIRMSLVENSDDAKEAFIEAMKVALSAAAQTMGQGVLEWPDPPQPAPESERSGSA